MPYRIVSCWHGKIVLCEHIVLVLKYKSTYRFNSVNLIATRATKMFFQNNLTFPKCITLAVISVNVHL